MSNNKVIEIKNPELKSNDLLTDLIRSSAKEMLARAVEVELEDFLAKHAGLSTWPKATKTAISRHLVNILVKLI